MKQLAIVIPYYKFDYFEECLQSLANQTNKQFTLYIGDDCSPNSPKVILNKYQNLNIVYKRFKSNLGSNYLTKQWDRCIDLVNNEPWIMMLGDDDKISDNVVEEFYNSLNEIESKKINVVRNNVIEIDGNNTILREFFYPRYEKSTDSFIKKITQNYHVTLPEYIFKKESYKKIGFKHFPFAFGSDNIAWLEFTNGNFIYTLPKGICYMRLSEHNISGNNKNIKEKVFSKYLTNKYIINNILNFFEDYQKKIIIEKGYKYLLFSDNKNIKERIYYLLIVLKYLKINEIKNIFFKL